MSIKGANPSIGNSSRPFIPKQDMSVELSLKNVKEFSNLLKDQT